MCDVRLRSVSMYMSCSMACCVRSTPHTRGVTTAWPVDRGTPSSALRYCYDVRGSLTTQRADVCPGFAQELTLHPRRNRRPPVEALAMLLMSQAPTLRVLSMHHDVMPHHLLNALSSLRALTHLMVRDWPYHRQQYGPTVCICHLLTTHH